MYFDPKYQTQHHHSLRVTHQCLVPFLSICTVGLSAVAVASAITSTRAIMSGHQMLMRHNSPQVGGTFL